MTNQKQQLQSTTVALVAAQQQQQAAVMSTAVNTEVKKKRRVKTPFSSASLIDNKTNVEISLEPKRKKYQDWELFERFHKTKKFDEAGKIVDFDKGLRNQLVVNNGRLVSFVINKYCKSALKRSKGKISKEDLLQEGNLVLFNAILNFDPTKGFAFSTYATWWIWQACIKFIKENSFDLSVPAHIQLQHQSLTKKLAAEGLKINSMSVQEAEKHDISEKALGSLRAFEESCNKTISLDSPIYVSNGEERFTFHDTLSGEENDMKAETACDMATVIQFAAKALESLTEREKIVMLLRYNIISSQKEVEEQIKSKGNKTNGKR